MAIRWRSEHLNTLNNWKAVTHSAFKNKTFSCLKSQWAIFVCSNVHKIPRCEHQIRSGRMPSLKNKTFYKTFQVFRLLLLLLLMLFYSYLTVRLRESVSLVCGVNVYAIFASMKQSANKSSFVEQRLPHHFWNCFVVARSIKVM